MAQVEIYPYGTVDKAVAIQILKDDRGWQQTRTKVGDILYRRRGRVMSITHIRTWRDLEMDYEQESRVDLPDEADAKGTRDLAVQLAEYYDWERQSW